MLTRTWWVADWRDGQKSIIITPDNKLARERALVNYQTMSRTSIWQIAGSTNDTVEVQLRSELAHEETKYNMAEDILSAATSANDSLYSGSKK